MLNITRLKNIKGLSASSLPRIKRSIACRNRLDYMNGVAKFSHAIHKAFSCNQFVVYVLWANNEIVYVGQSLSVYQRLQTHKYRINYSHVSLLNFKDFKTMEDVEIRLIQKHCPRYNKRHNPNFGYAIIK